MSEGPGDPEEIDWLGAVPDGCDVPHWFGDPWELPPGNTPGQTEEG